MGTPINICRPRHGYNAGSDISRIFPGSSDTFYSSDIGRILFKSSDKAVLGTGGSSFSTSLMLGFLYYVEAAASSSGSSGGSTVPVLYMKFNPSVEYAIKYTTLGSTVHPATTDLGRYIGLSTIATVAGCQLAMGNIGNEPGTSDARFLKITGYSTNRRMIYGYVVRNSSVIAW
jgi:hypothetical protein